MKKLIIITLVLAITFAIDALRTHTPPSSHVAEAVQQPADEPQPTIVNKEPPEAAEPATEPQEAPEAPAAQPETCRSAIAKVWPPHLQAGAITVMTNENVPEDPSAKGAVNKDAQGSQDFGCFQINNYWHPAYFTGGDWSDPLWAAQYALTIYEGRQAATGNGWSAWYAVQGILW